MSGSRAWCVEGGVFIQSKMLGTLCRSLELSTCFSRFLCAVSSCHLSCPTLHFLWDCWALLGFLYVASSLDFASSGKPGRELDSPHFLPFSPGLPVSQCQWEFCPLCNLWLEHVRGSPLRTGSRFLKKIFIDWLEREENKEKGGGIHLLFHLHMHLLVDFYMCPDLG